MSTIMGNGREYDITFKCDSNLKTTTSQFRVVAMVPTNQTTTADDRLVTLVATGTVADFTTAAHYAIGINQSYLTSDSEVCTVRLFGVSKAICAASVPAGSFVVPYYGTSITSRQGNIIWLQEGVSTTMATTSVTAHTVILGRALEDGQARPRGARASLPLVSARSRTPTRR